MLSQDKGHDKVSREMKELYNKVSRGKKELYEKTENYTFQVATLKVWPPFACAFTTSLTILRPI